MQSPFASAGASEHESHHPGATTSLDTVPALSDPSSKSAAGTAMETPQGVGTADAIPVDEAGKADSMQGMSKMMAGMGQQSARQEIYPSLMGLPDMSMTNRGKIEALAEERIHTGTKLLQNGQERLLSAIQSGNHEAAFMATQQIREGNAEVESGVAAHRLMLEGSLPQTSALEWFRRTMSLANPSAPPQLAVFHYFTMLILLAFAAAAVGFHFYKSRRVAALLTKLAAEKAGAATNANASASSTVAKSAAKDSTQKYENSSFEVDKGLTALGLPTKPPSKSNAWTGQLLVSRIFKETPQVKTFRLVSPDYGKLPFSYLPGQFLTVTVNPYGENIKRSYTISSSPTHLEYCEVTVRHEAGGIVSGYLHERVHEGELLQVTAPSGKFTFLGDAADSIVLIGGGVGVTPMVSIIRYLTERSWFGDIYLIYGCKSEEEVVFREELEYLMQRYENLHVVFTASEVNPQTWPYHTGRITKELIVSSVPNIASRHIHLCGPKPMMEAIKVVLADLGVPAKQVEVEVFSGREPQRSTETQPVTVVGQGNPLMTFSSKVNFVKSGKIVTLTQPKTILEAAEDIGVSIDYSCRSGVCGICKVKLISGQVAMEVEDSLEPEDKVHNIILACQATPTGDVSVDA